MTNTIEDKVSKIVSFFERYVSKKDWLFLRAEMVEKKILQELKKRGVERLELYYDINKHECGVEIEGFAVGDNILFYTNIGSLPFKDMVERCEDLRTVLGIMEEILTINIEKLEGDK